MASIERGETPTAFANYSGLGATKSFQAGGISPTAALKPNATPHQLYYSNLRDSIVRIQADINSYLTQRMGEAKNEEMLGKRSSNLKDVDEEKAEENYGEEVDEE